MTRSRVADRGDGLQIWRVPANVLNKQSRTADKGLYSSLGVRLGANNPYRKNQITLRNIRHSLGPGRIIWHDLSTEKWIYEGDWLEGC
jgi:hypothetical protein